MNCSKTSRSAWSQSPKAVPSPHPPAHQISLARCSICCWVLRCSSAVKITFSAIMLGNGFLILGSLFAPRRWRCGVGSRWDGQIHSQQATRERPNRRGQCKQACPRRGTSRRPECSRHTQRFTAGRTASHAGALTSTLFSAW